MIVELRESCFGGAEVSFNDLELGAASRDYAGGMSLM
jgi:hypothetical protein